MRIIIEYLAVMMLLFVAWYLASVTRRLMNRLKDPDGPKVRRQFIVLRPGEDEPPPVSTEG